MSGRLRTYLILNAAAWAMTAFTIGLLKIWIQPDESFLLMGLLIAICFTFVATIDFFSRHDS